MAFAPNTLTVSTTKVLISPDFDSAEPAWEKVYSIADIKSICNSPDGILMLKPTEEWWAEGLVNEKGEELFKMDGAKIYKGRWMIDNTFSYPEKHDLVLGED